MYNMDEKGFLLGVHNRTEVIVRHRRRLSIENTDGSREWITLVECTCANNFMLPPLVVHRGKELSWLVYGGRSLPPTAFRRNASNVEDNDTPAPGPGHRMWVFS